MEERRMVVRRLADRELHELIEKKTGTKANDWVRQRKKRRAIRHTCKVVMEIDVKHTANEAFGHQVDQHTIKGRVLDMSEGGAAIFCKYDLKPGLRLKLGIKLYDGSTLETPAEVRWSKPKTAREGYALGLQFLDSTSNFEKRVNTFLGELDATLGM